MIRFIYTLLIIFSPFTLWAKSPNQIESPIHITANALEFNKQEERAIFKGEVVTSGQDFTLEADIMEVFYTKKTIDKPLNTVKTSGQNINKIIAYKNVKMRGASGQSASAEHAIYDIDKNNITLNGNVILKQEGNIIKGKKLIYDITNDMVHITNDDSKVKMLLNN